MALSRYQAGTAWIRVSPDFQGFGDKLERQVKENLGKVAASVEIDTSRARNQMRELANEKVRPGVEPRVNAKALAKAETLLNSLDRRHRTAVVEAEVNAIKAEQELARITGQRRVVVDAKLNTNSFTREFDKARTEISKQLAKSGTLTSGATKQIQRVLSRALKTDEMTNRLLPHKKEWENAQSEAKRLRDIVDGKATSQRTPKSMRDEEKANAALVERTQQLATATENLTAARKVTADRTAELAKLERDLTTATELRTSATDQKTAADQAAAWAAKEVAAAEEDRLKTLKAIDRLNVRKTNWEGKENRTPSQKRDRTAALKKIEQELAAKHSDLDAIGRRLTLNIGVDTIATNDAKQALSELAAAEDELTRAKALRKRMSEQLTTAEREEGRVSRAFATAEKQYTEAQAKVDKLTAAEKARIDQERTDAQKELVKQLDIASAAEARYTALLPKQAREANRLASALQRLRSQALSTSTDVAAILARSGALTERERTRAKLTVTGNESDTATGNLRRSIPNNILNSRVDKDVVAVQAAMRSAASYDRVMSQLEQRNYAVARAQESLAAATAEVNRHTEEGTRATEAGIAALAREQHELERLAHVKKQQRVVSQAADTSRADYNSTARGLENRINLNPVRRGIDVLDSVAKRGISFVTERLIFAGRLLSAVSSLGMAAAGSVAVLGAVNLVPLVGAIGQVGGALALLPAMAAGAAAAIAAIAVGFNGVSDAFKAATKLSEAKAKPVDGTAVRNSQKQVEKAQRSQARAAESGSRQIADAEKSVQRAQKSSQDAQQDLTRARKDARGEIDEMNRSLKRLVLDEESAALSVEEARKSLRETMSDPDADSTDRKRANLSYREALQNLEDVRHANKKTREEVAEANRKGVEGSDTVVQAQERATSAQEQLVESQQNLAQTQQDVAQSNADAAEAVADAQQAMVDAMSGGGSAVDNAAAEYEEALKKLAPQAQGFVVGATKMGDAWTDVRKATQDRLFQGLAIDLVEVGQKQLPVLREGLAAVAEELNGGIRLGMDYLKSNRGVMDFREILNNSATATGNLGRAIAIGTGALTGLAAESSNTLPRMSAAVEDIANRFSAFINKGRESGAIDVFMARMIDRTKEVSRLVYDLGRIVGGVFSGAKEQGEGMLQTFGQWARDTADFLRSAEGQEKVANFFARVNDMFGTALHVVGQLGSVLSNIVIPAFNTISDVVGPILRLVTDVAVGMAEWGGVLKTVLTGYLALRIATGIFGRLGTAARDAGTHLVNKNTALSQMRQNYQNVGRAANLSSTQIGKVHQMGAAIVRQHPSLVNVGTAYRNAADQAGRFSRTQGAWAGAQTGFAAAAGAARTGVTRLSDAIGGPLGAGLMVGAGLMAAWSMSASKAKTTAEGLRDASKEIAAAQKDLYGSLRASRGAMDSSVVSDVSREVDAEFDRIKTAVDGKLGKTDYVAEFVASFVPYTPVTPISKTKSESNQNRNNDYNQWKGAQRVLDDLQITSDQVTQALTGTDDQWVKFRRTLQATGPDGQKIVKIFQASRDRLVDQRNAILSIEPGYLDLADAVGVLTDKASTAEERATALSKALDALTPEQEQQDAVYAFGEALDSIKERIGQLKDTGGWNKELLNEDGSLNLMKDNGRTIYDAIIEGRDKLAALQESGEDTTGYFSEFTAEIVKLGEAAGISAPAMQHILDTLNATPDNINLVVNLTGLDDATADLVKLRAAFDDIEPGQTVTKEVELKGGDEAKAAIEELGGKVQWLDKENGKATVTLDSETFNEEFDLAVAKMQALNILKSSATVDLETGMLRVNAGQAATIINSLDQYTADPVAKLLVAELTANQGFAMDKLHQLRDEETEPKVGADITELQEKVRIAREALYSLPNLSPAPVNRDSFNAPSDPGAPAQPGVADGQYAQAPEDLSIVYKWKAAENRWVRQKSENGQWVDAYATGGQIPGRATGGRMPTSGPGTEVTDGFLAVDGAGVPRARVDGGEWVINAAMSAKYNWLLGAINADKLTGFATGGQLPGGSPEGGSGFQLGAVGNPFAPMVQGLGDLGSMFSAALGGQAIPAWTKFATQLQIGAAGLINPALDGISGLVNNLGQLFPAVAGIVTPAWQALSSGILDAKTTSIDPAFAGIQGGLTTVEAAFTNGVSNIRTQWDGIRSATADPVRFTIDSVFNQGLVGMWNSVSDLIGATPMTPYVAKFATGGVLPGYTPGRDVHQFYSPALGELHLSGGEAIMRPEWTRAVGGPGAVEKMNREARSGRLKTVHGDPAVYRNGGVFGRFATGGTIANGSKITSPIQRVMWDAIRTAFPNAILTSGTRYADVGSGFDNHMGQRALDLAGPMPEMARWIHQLNQKQPVEELIHAPLQGWRNLKSGQPLNYGPATDADHYDHVHWAMSAMKSFAGRLVSMATGGALGSHSAIQSPEEMINSALDPARGELARITASKQFPGKIGQLPKLIGDSMSRLIGDKAVGLAKAMGMYSGPAIADDGSVERWRPMVIAALRRNGFEPNQRNQDLMLAQIRSESGGRPDAVQQVIDVNSGGNEAVGLLQIAKGTWPGVRDPSLPDDRTDPWANMNAALRYYRRTYGDDLGTMWGQGHGYDRGGIFEDGTFGFNTSGKPEAVFTNKQFLMLDKLVESLLHPKLFARLTGETPVAAMGSTPAPKSVEVDPETIALGDPAAEEPLHPDVLALYEKYGIDPPGTPPKDDPAAPPTDPTVTVTSSGDTPTPDNPELPPDPPAAGTSTTNAPIPGVDTGVADDPEDPLATYTGPLADVLKKGRVIGQAAQGMATPEAMARLGDIDYDYKRAKAVKQRLTVATKYRTDAEMLAADLRAQGKEKEAAEVEAGIAGKEREIAGGDPQRLAELATMADGDAPSVTLRQQAEEQFKQYLAENAVGISESVLSAGIAAAGNSGGGDIVINGGIRTNSWKDAQRSIERTQKRKTRQAARTGYR